MVHSRWKYFPFGVVLAMNDSAVNRNIAWRLDGIERLATCSNATTVAAAVSISSVECVSTRLLKWEEEEDRLEWCDYSLIYHSCALLANLRLSIEIYKWRQSVKRHHRTARKLPFQKLQLGIVFILPNLSARVADCHLLYKFAQLYKQLWFCIILYTVVLIENDQSIRWSCGVVPDGRFQTTSILLMFTPADYCTDFSELANLADKLNSIDTAYRNCPFDS